MYQSNIFSLLSLNIKDANNLNKSVTFTKDADDLMLWHVNIKDISSASVLNDILQSLKVHERQKVMKFHFLEDRKRALLSILLQRKMICQRFEVEDFEYQISRTSENKPFVKIAQKDIGTWNYNVSHHGDYVCIASHSNILIGVDLVDTQTRSASSRGATTFVDMFKGQLTAGEIGAIHNVSSDRDKYTLFFVIWSLKEAFIKAIGSGLGFDLTQIDFTVHFPSPDLSSVSRDQQCDVSQSLKGHATARIFGKPRTDWRFEFSGLDDRHILTVARGPVADAIPSYQQSAGWNLPAVSSNASRQMLLHQLSHPVPPSIPKSVYELLPNWFSSRSPTCISAAHRELESSHCSESEECKSGVSPPSVAAFIDAAITTSTSSVKMLC